MKRTALIAGLLLITACLGGPAHAEYAVAWGQSGTKWWVGWAKNKQTENDAKTEAMARCRKGERECRLIAAGRAACLAIAVPQKGNASAWWQSKALKEEAESAALKACEAKRGKCSVRVSFCDHGAAEKAAKPAHRPTLPKAPLTAADLAAFRQKVTGCWKPPAGTYPPDASVTVQMRLKPDGSLETAPQVLQSSRLKSDVKAAFEADAVAALQRCAPYSMLPADKYEAWKTLKFEFLAAPAAAR